MKIVGFDLGHGETAVAIANLEDDAAPMDKDVWGNGMKSVITAIGWHPEQGPIIGASALTNSKVQNSRICFKGDPAGRPGETPGERDERNHVTQAYFKAYADRLLQNNDVAPDGDTKYYVGCPSGWTRSSIELYGSMLRGSTLSAVIIVKESRAAFLNTVESKVCALTLEDLRKEILIVDIGSSTTDLTLVHEMLDEDFGNPQLGAALIDQALFQRTLDAMPEHAQWADAFAKNPKLKARCEIACRRAKELYFKSELDYLDDPTLVASVSESIAGLGEFKPQVDAQGMAAILDGPLPALNGQSWRETFRRSLVDAREKLKQRAIEINALVLTGGPSRMQFTHTACREVFPHAQFQFDSNPEFCISRGLAYAGRYETRTSSFMREIARLSESSKFGDIMTAALPQLVDDLVETLGDGLTNEVIRPSIEDWKAGRVRTLEDLEGVTDAQGVVTKEGHLSRVAKAWLESESAQSKVREVVLRWFDHVQPLIYQAGIDALCAEYRISPSKLRPDAREDLRKLLTGHKVEGLDVLDMQFLNTVIGAIVVVITTAIIHALLVAIVAAHGPMAWLPGLAIGAVAAFVGMDQATKLVKTFDIPNMARSGLFLVASVEKRCDQMKPKLKAAVKQQLAANMTSFKPLVTGLQALIVAELKSKAEDVLVYIGMMAKRG